jgi:dihydrofolate reductase
MSKIFGAMAASVDGYITARDAGPEHGLGVGGEVLHDWYFDGESQSRVVPELRMSETSRDFVDGFAGRTGAVIVGRHTYDDAGRWDGAGPHPTAALIVLSHRPAPPEATSAQTFTSTLDEAVATARAAAVDLDINIMGGEVLTAALEAGLVDELVIHQVPMLLGGGRPFFQELPSHVQLSLVEVVPAPGVTHLHYRVDR